MHNSTLIESVCKFVTADIMITSGGSFSPMIAPFRGNPWHPLIFEEQHRHVHLKINERRIVIILHLMRLFDE
jgi:hypothetical protein